MKNNNDSNLKEVEKLIGYQFRNKHLGLSAITTRAYSTEYSKCTDNQALEFLGDAVLSLVTAELLYEKWSEHKHNKAFHDMTPEGVMTKIRQEVVNNQYLADCANRHGLCDYIYDIREKPNEGTNTGPGDDIIEALIAAIYLDNNKSIVQAKKFILNFLNLSTLLNDEVRLIEAVTKKNSKDKLIHKIQQLEKQTPDIKYPEIKYRFNKDDNTHHFVLGIQINGIVLPGITGEGSNKAIAEYKVAEKAYQLLKNMNWNLSKIG